MACLRTERLESRDCPAPAYIGGGVVRLRAGVELQPFSDWRGELAVFDSGDRVWVGAGPGGGPRVAVFDPATGERDRSDWFAGDPASRVGVVFVGGIPAERLVDVPHLTYGPADGFAVYLDFDRPASAAWVRDVTAAVAATFDGLGVRVTTDRPDGPPGGYGVVVIGAPTGWYHAAGYAPASTWGLDRESFEERPVYATAFPDPLLTAAVATHEAGHGFGLGHAVGNPLDVMSEGGPGPRSVFGADERAAIIRRARGN